MLLNFSKLELSLKRLKNATGYYFSEKFFFFLE